MSWACWLGDTMTGAIDRPVDLPAFNWEVTVSDGGLGTVRPGGVDGERWGGLTVPWTALGEAGREGPDGALCPGKRSLLLCWDDGVSEIGRPVLWGSIGSRTDTWLDTSFSIESPMGILAQRVAVPELAFGTGEGSTSPGTTVIRGSARAVACALVDMCTGWKPGGALPIDLPYLGEAGEVELALRHCDAGNLSCAELISGIASAEGGPDIQFRPYMLDRSHVRLRMVAGSDQEPCIPQDGVATLTCFPGGGTAQGLSVARRPPVQRVYATGPGTDAAQLCHLAEDLSLCRAGDPWPLCEGVETFADADGAASLAAAADGVLASSAGPLAQVECEVDMSDPAAPRPGDIWPGELVDLLVEGFPSIPDGVRRLRLQSMSGDQSTRVRLKFDPISL